MGLDRFNGLATGRASEAVGVVAARFGRRAAWRAIGDEHQAYRRRGERKNGFKVPLAQGIRVADPVYWRRKVRNEIVGEQGGLVRLLAGHIASDSGIGVDAPAFGGIRTRRMARRWIVVEPGDSGFYRGEVVGLQRLATGESSELRSL